MSFGRERLIATFSEFAGQAEKASRQQTQPNLRDAEEKNFLSATGEKCGFCCKPESQS